MCEFILVLVTFCVHVPVCITQRWRETGLGWGSHRYYIMYNRNLGKQSERNVMRTCERNRYERNVGVKGNCEKLETYFPKGYGASIFNATSTTMKERLCKEHIWLVQTYEAVEFQKVYRGTVYSGVIGKVGWHPRKGFGAKVSYSDGYTENLSIQELQGFDSSRVYLRK